jgi:16S rRNA (cytosine1402-N4)-methyltransferase
MENNQTYHIPVMLNECIDALQIDPNGTYVDVTFGGGGHSRAIFEKLSPKGRLIVFDQDKDARRNASSHQFDEVSRGFSFRGDADLDMRMNQKAELSAKKLVNEYSEEDLYRVFRMYGEVSNTGKLVRTIMDARVSTPINTTGELTAVIEKCAPKHKEHKYFAQVFQAIRIEVNQEMSVLEDFLKQTEAVIRPGGRLVIMSYHSLEDRLVKNFMKRGSLTGEITKDFFGNVLKPFSEVVRHPIVADELELERNSRARSAKLRIAVRDGE